MADWPDRLNRFIDALQAGRRPDRGQASSMDELEDLRMAAAIMGSREDQSMPDPAFLDGLRTRLRLSRQSRTRVSRAGLLRAAGFWAAGLASGLGIVWGTGSVRRAARPATASSEISLQGGDWYPVGSLSDIGSHEVVSVEAGAVPAFVIRDGESVRALSRVCTHMGCLLRYNASEKEFACPCHGATFDLNGNLDSEYGVTLPPLPAVGARVVNGTVYVLGA